MVFLPFIFLFLLAPPLGASDKLPKKKGPCSQPFGNNRDQNDHQLLAADISPLPEQINSLPQNLLKRAIKDLLASAIKTGISEGLLAGRLKPLSLAGLRVSILAHADAEEVIRILHTDLSSRSVGQISIINALLYKLGDSGRYNIEPAIPEMRKLLYRSMARTWVEGLAGEKELSWSLFDTLRLVENDAHLIDDLRSIYQLLSEDLLYYRPPVVDEILLDIAAETGRRNMPFPYLLGPFSDLQDWIQIGLDHDLSNSSIAFVDLVPKTKTEKNIILHRAIYLAEKTQGKKLTRIIQSTLESIPTTHILQSQLMHIYHCIGRPLEALGAAKLSGELSQAIHDLLSRLSTQATTNPQNTPKITGAAHQGDVQEALSLFVSKLSQVTLANQAQVIGLLDTFLSTTAINRSQSDGLSSKSQFDRIKKVLAIWRSREIAFRPR